MRFSFYGVGLHLPSQRLIVFGFVAWLPFVCSTRAFAAGGQYGNISGTVVDGATRSGVANAKIALASPSSTFHAVTTANGSFTIDGITADTYTLTVEAPGFDRLWKRASR